MCLEVIPDEPITPLLVVQLAGDHPQPLVLAPGLLLVLEAPHGRVGGRLAGVTAHDVADSGHLVT